MNKAVAGIFRNNKNEFLLQYHNFMKAFTPPGGKMDPDIDHTTKDALVREIKEELDVDIKNSNIYKINRSIVTLDTMGNYILDTFFIDQKINPINTEPEKHLSLAWYSIDKIQKFYSISYSAQIILDSYQALDDYVEYKKRKTTKLLLSI